MAVKKLHAGNFKAGNQSSKGHGRPKITDGDVLLSKEIFSNEMLATFIEVLNLPLGEFFKEEVNQDQPAYRALFVSAINNGIQTGDLKVMEHVQNRIMGKIKEVVKMETNETSDVKQYEEMKAELTLLIAQGLQ